MCLRGAWGFLSANKAPESFSADWTLFSRGERGGSALRGLTTCRMIVGGERVLPWKEWRVLEMLGKGEGERWGDRACGEEVQARGDGGILLVDFLLPTLV